MRTFIAIELPQEVKNALVKLQEQLRKTGADVNWVQPDNIHLTLKFLGEIGEKKLDKINSILEKAAKEYSCFQAEISTLGAFPKINYPRVIWVGIEKGGIEIKKIVQELEEQIEKIGIAKESRPFSTHITIARVRSALNQQALAQELNQLIHYFDEKKLQFKARGITLFKSILGPGGAAYEPLKVINLKDS